MDDDYCGFDELGVHDTDGSFMGFDYMSLIKGAGGMLSGAGGMFGGGGGAAATPAAAAEAEKRRLEDDRRRAEKSAQMWKIVGIVGLGIVLLGGGVAAVTLGRK